MTTHTQCCSGSTPSELQRSEFEVHILFLPFRSLASGVLKVWGEQEVMSAPMVKRVCGLCLLPVWKHPAPELPGCCEEELQGGTKAAGSSKQIIYRYLQNRFPRLAQIFNLSETHLTCWAHPQCSCNCLYRRQRRPCWNKVRSAASWSCSSSFSGQRDWSLKRLHTGR